MGNNQTTPIKLGIRCDESIYNAGDTITGKVYLSVIKKNIRNRSQPIQAKSIRLVLKGEEISVITYNNKYDTNTTSATATATTSSSSDYYYGGGNTNNMSNNNLSGIQNFHHELSEYVESDKSILPIVNLNVTLKEFDNGGIIKPGQYEYPFEWKLPTNLPSTMKCSKSSHYEGDGVSFCEIKYTICAYVDKGDGSSSSSSPLDINPNSSLFGGNNNNNNTNNSNEYSTQSICINSIPTNRNNPGSSSSSSSSSGGGGLILDPEEYPIRGCFCTRKGKMTLGWDIDKSIGSPPSVPLPPVPQRGRQRQDNNDNNSNDNNIINLNIIGTNNSTIDVDHIRIRWIETIIWNTINNTTGMVEHTEKVERNIYDKKIIGLNELSSHHWQSLNEIPTTNSNSRNNNNNTNNTWYGLQHLISYDHQTSSLNDDLLTINDKIILAHDSRDSYTGAGAGGGSSSLIQVKHMLVVTIVTPGSCCITNPELAAQVYVQRNCNNNNNYTPSTTTTNTAVATTNQQQGSKKKKKKTTIISPTASASVVATTATLNKVDMECIDRLMNFGGYYSRSYVIETYIQCNKDETATANMLLDEQQQQQQEEEISPPPIATVTEATATAPLEYHDDYNDDTTTTTTNTTPFNPDYNPPPPIAQATLLPDNWSAQTSDIITIPVVSATDDCRQY